MIHEENKFEMLINEAQSTLNFSYQELKDRYKCHPVCLMEYLEGNIYEQVIEVRFNDQEATLCITFDNENICNASFLFYDSLNDEDLFIEYLNLDTEYNYDFKSSSWLMADCYLKVKPPIKSESAFCFYK